MSRTIAEVRAELTETNIRFNERMNLAVRLRAHADALAEESQDARIKAAEMWGWILALEKELEGLGTS